MNGNDNDFYELVTYFGDYDLSGNDNVYHGGLEDVGESPPHDWPLSAPMFNIDNYKPGGLYSSDPNYQTDDHHDVTIDSDDDDGIYYSDTFINISDEGIEGTFTLVAEEEINISGGKSVLTPYINNLLAFGKGEECNDAAVSFSSNENVYNGIVYSPVGMIYMSGNANDPGTDEDESSTLDGCLWGARVILSGEEITVQNCGDYWGGESLISLVE